MMQFGDLEETFFNQNNDEFLDLEFHVTCWMCKVDIVPGMSVLGILRTDSDMWLDQLGPKLHFGHHVVLIDLVA